MARADQNDLSKENRKARCCWWHNEEGGKDIAVRLLSGTNLACTVPRCSAPTTRVPTNKKPIVRKQNWS